MTPALRAKRMYLTLAVGLLAGLSGAPASGGDARPASSESESIVVPEIAFEQETLPNGLRVIYAPMDNAPVVHVRVLYHVGSRDETPDRQGFAHLFEHMMFRGSRHVPSEEHMRLVNSVGGNSNAFTSFDQTTYVNTVPSNALEMALWLEADRMASFTVDEETFVTERSVVNEEYLQRVANPPYGRFFMDLFDLAYAQSHYRWTPIGNMEQLAESTVQELQDFFDLFYVPSNAVLTVAGRFDVEEARGWVRDYFGWIEGHNDVPRRSPAESPQEETRRREVRAAVPLVRLALAFQTTDYADEDQVALEVLANVLGQGRSSRLYRELVSGESPVAAAVSAGNQRLEDKGQFILSAGLLPGGDPAAAEAQILAAVRTLVEGGVDDDELDKARTQLKLQIINSLQTATSVATVLAEAEAFGGDADLANRLTALIDEVDAHTLRDVAARYLTPQRMNVLTYLPDPAAATQAAGERQDAAEAAEAAAEEAREVEESRDEPQVARRPEVQFPESFPTAAPVPQDVIAASFERGESFEVDGLNVVVLPDRRLPLVGMTLLMPAGGDAVEPGREGLAGVTADLLVRGAGGLSADDFSQTLESRGINLGVSDGGDHTRVAGSFPAGQTPAAADLLVKLLTDPTLDEREFTRLKARSAAGLQQALSDPSGVAGREASTVLFGGAPAGRNTTPQSLAGADIDAVRDWYRSVFRPDGTTLILAGDVDRSSGESFARTLMSAWETRDGPADADYTLPDKKRRILLVDNPVGGQSAIRIVNRAYTNDSDEKYAGSVAGMILSGGIESRLNRVLRAEQGLTYGASARFDAGRHAGSFQVGFSTRPETTGQAVRSTFEVLQRMATDPVADDELAEAQRRVAGSMVMQTQTAQQQAQLRSSVVLNDYPEDYFDTYADRIAAVTVEDVQRVMADYATSDSLSVIVVGPASVVRDQLAEFGEVEVVPMPLLRR